MPSSFLLLPRPPSSTPFPYTTLFRSGRERAVRRPVGELQDEDVRVFARARHLVERRICDERLARANTRTSSSDRKSTRLNSSHPSISYAVFCLKKKKKQT